MSESVATNATPDATQPTSQETAPQLPEGFVKDGDQLFIETKVNNEVKRLPFEEARIRLQKELAVEEGFQKNAETRKELERIQQQHQNALKFYELSQKAMFQNDADAGRQALELMGYQMEDDDDTQDASQPSPQNGVSPEIQKELAELRKFREEYSSEKQATQAEQIRNRVYGELDNAVSQDAQLSKILKSKSEASGLVTQMIRDRIGHKIGKLGLPAGASTYNTVIQEIKQELKALGTLSDEPKNPSPGFPGMGPSVSGVGFAEALAPAKRPDPASPIGAKGGYAKNLMDRWQYDLANRD